jgi:Uma2 family endonuclease
MPTLVLDPHIEDKLLDQRRAWGGDKFDEVWDGVYIMSPLPNNEHRQLMAGLITALVGALADDPQVRVFPGVNVSDRQDDWKRNFRCPDVAVVLPGSLAIDCDSHLFGGPDFAAEIISDYDRTREICDFYAKVGVRELLLVDRNPWQLELYRLAGAKFIPVGVSEPSAQQLLASEVLPLTFRLLPRKDARPQIEVCKPSTGECWLS